MRGLVLSLMLGMVALTGCSSGPWQASSTVVGYAAGSYTVDWKVTNVSGTSLQLVCRVDLSSAGRSIGHGDVHELLLRPNKKIDESDAVVAPTSLGSIVTTVVCLD